MPNRNKPTSLRQHGAIQFILLLILFAGIVAGIWLVTQGPLKLFPKATVSGPIAPETSFSLEAFNKPKDNVVYQVGEEARIDLYFRSDIDPVNLLVAKLKFPQDLLEVTRIDHSGTEPLISRWVEEYYDNNTGEISLVGGIPNPGFKTELGGFTPLVSRIYFKTKAVGSANISLTDESAIYRNSDNVNMLTIKRPITITLASTPLPSATITPSPSSLATVTVSPTTVATNGTVTVTWSGIPNPHLKDYMNILLSDESLGGGAHTFWINNNCTWFTPDTGTPKASESCSINLTQESLQAGTYRMVLYSGTTPGVTIQLGSSNIFTVTPAAPSPSPVATPVPVSGDGNGDGKIDLIDLSVLFTDFNKESGFKKGIDLNGDGKINTFDFSLMRNLLIQKGVIKDSGSTGSPL